MTSPAKPISELSDIDLITAVYGDGPIPPHAITLTLEPIHRDALRYRLFLLQLELSAKALGYDVREPPFNVPCPTCLAFAGSPCLSERREKPTLGMVWLWHPMLETTRVVETHPARQEHYLKHPEFRVRFSK